MSRFFSNELEQDTGGDFESRVVHKESLEHGSLFIGKDRYWGNVSKGVEDVDKGVCRDDWFARLVDIGRRVIVEKCIKFPFNVAVRHLRGLNRGLLQVQRLGGDCSPLLHLFL